MENKSVYALLIGVGNYEKMNIVNLPTYKMDLALLGTAINSGLKVPYDNIRLMAGNDNNGFITTTDLAKAIADFRSKLGSEDTFIFYFSGHGRDKNILFSNGQVELQSVIDFVEKLPAKNKMVILDCCYSGRFHTAGARQMSFEESMNDFAGHGIAVLASSAANEVSRLGPNGNHSMFTGALSTAIGLNKRVHEGKTSLNDIYEETMHLVKAWNQTNPGKEQQPVFRSSIGGTIFFQVEEYKPYEQMQINYQEETYIVDRVEPLSSLTVKRLCAFVILKNKQGLEDLPAITKEIAERIKYAEVFSTAKSEEKFEGLPARVVWCYFGYDEEDLVNHNHCAYTIWAADEEMCHVNYKPNKNAKILDDIYVFENTSYQLVKRIQQRTQTREEFIEDNRRLLTTIVNMGERFVADLQEVKNKIITIEDLQEKYGDWIINVRRKYIQLTDGDVPPNDLHDWSEEITTLAGWILDCSLLLENEKGGGIVGERENWLINNAIKKYHESIEKIKKIEDEIEF